MARYRIEESVVDTDNATFSYRCGGRKAGYGTVRNEVYRSRKGRWYRVVWYSWCEDNRQLDYAEWISPQEAARLILADGADLPDYPELKAAAEDVSE